MLELPEMISVKEIKEHLGISQERVYQLIKTKGFPKIIIGHRYYIPKEQYIKWINDNLRNKIIL